MLPFRDVQVAMTSESGTPLWRRPGLLIGVALIVLALIGAGILAFHRQHEDGLAIGSTHSGDYRVMGGSYTGQESFTVPNADIDVTVEIGSSATDYDTRAAEDLQAPADGVLVRMEWTSHRTDDGSGPNSGIPSRLSVRSGKVSVPVAHRLTPQDPDNHDLASRLVVVPGAVDDVELVVGFAGRTQSVRITTGRRSMGSFATLYRGGPQTAAEVASATQPADPDSPFRWNATAYAGTALRSPYLKGLGWARPGEEWVLLSGVGARWDLYPASWSGRDAFAEYTVRTTTVSPLINGERPVRVLRRPTQEAEEYGARSARGDYVFVVPKGAALSVHTAVRMQLDRDAQDAHTGAPAHTTERLSRTVEYSAVADPARGGRG